MPHTTPQKQAGAYQGPPGAPRRCRHCFLPEDEARRQPCIPDYRHGFVTRHPGESSVEAEARLAAEQGAQG
jgi:hypothetical protein